jgi:hypothetical protein
MWSFFNGPYVPYQDLTVYNRVFKGYIPSFKGKIMLEIAENDIESAKYMENWFIPKRYISSLDEQEASKLRSDRRNRP